MLKVSSTEDDPNLLTSAKSFLAFICTQNKVLDF